MNDRGRLAAVKNGAKAVRVQGAWKPEYKVDWHLNCAVITCFRIDVGIFHASSLSTGFGNLHPWQGRGCVEPPWSMVEGSPKATVCVISACMPFFKAVVMATCTVSNDTEAG